jgi:hypothetical protein
MSELRLRRSRILRSVVNVNQFHFTGDPQSPQRGLPSTPQQPRFIGLQTHTGQMLFRRIQWKAL